MKRLLALLAALVVAAPLVRAQEDPDPSLDPNDMIDVLLSGFLGFTEMSAPQLQQEVATIGGIPFRSDVPLAYLDKPSLGRYLEELIDDEYPTTRATADARTLIAFDLLAPGTDLRALRRRLLLENVAGFYDERPGKRRLYAISSHQSLTPANQIVMAHELRHALQDQYSDLHGLYPESVGDFDDRRLAFLCLLEGDATLVMQKFLLNRLPGGGEGLGIEEMSLPAPPVEGAPEVLRDQLVRPYTAGLDFARAIQAAGGWPAMQRAWASPPASTEQVLHPEKYASREAPQAVTIPWEPAGGRLLNEGVLGEIFASTLVEQEPGSAATSGWGGDLFRVWDVGGKTVLAWRAVWDSDADRREFGQALVNRFRAHHGTGFPRGAATVVRSGPWQFAMAEPPGATLLLASDDPALLDAALTALARPQS
jgi:hypothetical protein